jgi:N-acetyl sugar amidotransferase
MGIGDLPESGENPPAFKKNLIVTGTDYLGDMDKIGSIAKRQLNNRPNKVQFCKRCVMSNQRPRISFDEEGICSACRYTEYKNGIIDWGSREQELRKLCDRYRSTDGSFDIIVPCSGGKDSSSVAHKLKHLYGMHPLTVTWAPFMYTDIGRQNYEYFINSGFFNILAHQNGCLHRRLARISLEAMGEPFQPFIYGQMAFAFHIALRFNIKLIFFGENGEAEYGGSTKNVDIPFNPVEDWINLYFSGITVDDLVEWGQVHGLLKKSDYRDGDLTFYRPPPVSELKGKGIQMHWFGYYHKWTPQENFYYATEHTGFQVNPDGRSEGTYSKYASLDDKLDGLHYYLGFIKFGIGRTTSDAAHEIRDGHITREEVVALVRQFDGEFPKKYFEECLAYLDMTKEQFWTIVNRYRESSPHLWDKVDGEWRLKVLVENLH